MGHKLPKSSKGDIPMGMVGSCGWHRRCLKGHRERYVPGGTITHTLYARDVIPALGTIGSPIPRCHLHT